METPVVTARREADDYAFEMACKIHKLSQELAWKHGECLSRNEKIALAKDIEAAYLEGLVCGLKNK